MGAERGISLGICHDISRITIPFDGGGRRGACGWRHVASVAKARGFFSSSLTQALGPAPPAWLVAKCSLRSLDSRGGCPHMSGLLQQDFLTATYTLKGVGFR